MRKAVPKTMRKAVPNHLHLHPYWRWTISSVWFVVRAPGERAADMSSTRPAYLQAYPQVGVPADYANIQCSTDQRGSLRRRLGSTADGDARDQRENSATAGLRRTS